MGIAGGAAVSPPFVYWAYPGCEEVGDIFRTRLADGFIDPVGAPKDYVWQDGWRGHWSIFSTVAARGETVFAQSHRAGVLSHTFSKGTNWRAYSFPDADTYKAATPGTGGVVLTKDHCVFGTLSGELCVVALDSKGAWPKFTPEPFRFQTPSGKFISTAPAVADGQVWFGSDDGCLYGLASDGAAASVPARADLQVPRSKVKSPTGRLYSHPGPFGPQDNSNFVDDPALKPPFKLRWAQRTGAVMRAPLIAGEEDVFVFGMDGTLAAVEQETGRIRWRKRLEGPVTYQLTGVYDAGRLYVPWTGGSFFCLDVADGSVKWSHPMGKPTAQYPVLSGGVVAIASMRKGEKTPVIQAWDALTGEERWLDEGAGENGGHRAEDGQGALDERGAVLRQPRGHRRAERAALRLRLLRRRHARAQGVGRVAPLDEQGVLDLPRAERHAGAGDLAELRRRPGGDGRPGHGEVPETRSRLRAGRRPEPHLRARHPHVGRPVARRHRQRALRPRPRHRRDALAQHGLRPPRLRRHLRLQRPDLLPPPERHALLLRARRGEVIPSPFQGEGQGEGKDSQAQRGTRRNGSFYPHPDPLPERERGRRSQLMDPLKRGDSPNLEGLLVYRANR